MHKVKARGSTLNLGWLLKELVSDGSLTQTDANSIAAKQRSRDEALLHPLRIIASRQCCHAKTHKPLTLETLCQWLADRAKLDFASIDPLKINVPAVTAQMSFAYAKRYGILCLEVSPEELVVATAEPFDLGWIESLEQTSKRTVRPVVANPVDIEKYLVEFYSLAKSVFGAGAGAGSAAENAGIANFEQLLEVGKLKDPDAQDQHIVNIVDWLLQYAFTQRASDIHLEPRREKGRVRFRIDGVLHLVYELPASVMTAVTSRLKTLGRMDVAEKRRPQDGRLKTKTQDAHEIELRLSTLPTAFGEKMVMRIFDPDILLKSFSELGLANDDYDRWQSMVKNPNGIVLVTGPTGSGKTTTLYSSLKQLATSEVNVCTIEDPIEMVEASFNQMQVQPNIGLHFADGVRSLLRQDPDIIMVGEIRDLETAEMAIQAALTGHLVISTLHTNDAPSAITRLLELGVAPYLIKATVLGVMAQRLVRTLCPACKVLGESDADGWQTMIAPWKMNIPKHMYKPVGCLECRDTGYRGREGIYELLPLTDKVKPFVKENTEIGKLRMTAMKEGMRTLRLSGALKVAAGETTIEEVLRVAPFTGIE